MQAERLDDILPPITDDPSTVSRALDEARTTVEEAAHQASTIGRWLPHDPLRIAKKRLRWLVHCPQRAVLDDTSAIDAGYLAWGLIVDAAAKLLALGATRPVTVDTAAAFADADGDPRVSRYLAELDEPTAIAFQAEAATRLDQLQSQWPELSPGWYPRVEEPVRVPLADGTILLGGNLDILVGGPPSERPAVVIEAKSGKWHDSVRADAHFYGLLVGLRDDMPPAAVVTLAAGDGTTQVEPIRAGVLTYAAEQVATAMATAAELATGQPPEARPGRHCAGCPLRATCDAANREPVTEDRLLIPAVPA